jgi:serine/threonine protein kinase
MPEHPQVIHERYEKQNVFEKRGISIIYEAYDRVDDKPVLLKEIRINDYIFAGKAPASKAFEKEVEKLKEVSIPGFPEIINHFEDENSYYVVFPAIKGENLTERMSMRNNKPFSEAESLTLAQKLLELVSNTQKLSEPYVFYILRPSIISVDNDNNIHVNDLNIERIFDPFRKNKITPLTGFEDGEFTESQYSELNDVFSTGEILRYLLTARNPMDEGGNYNRYERSKEINSEIPLWLDNLIYEMCIAPGISKRPAVSKALDIIKKHIPEQKTSKKMEAQARISQAAERALKEEQKIFTSPVIKALAVALVIIIGTLLFLVRMWYADDCYTKGKAAYESKNFSESYRLFKNTAGIRKTVSVFEYLGVSALQVSKYDDAAKSFQKAADLTRNESDKGRFLYFKVLAMLEKGDKQAREGKLYDSLKSLEKALSVSTSYPSLKDPEYLFENADESFNSRNFIKASYFYNQAQKAVPDNALGYLGEAKSHYELANFKHSLETLMEAKKLLPELPEEYLVIAKRLTDYLVLEARSSKTIQDKIKLLESAVILSPTATEASYNLVKAYFESCEVEKAAEYLETLQNLVKPDNEMYGEILSGIRTIWKLPGYFEKNYRDVEFSYEKSLKKTLSLLPPPPKTERGEVFFCYTHLPEILNPRNFTSLLIDPSGRCLSVTKESKLIQGTWFECEPGGSYITLINRSGTTISEKLTRNNYLMFDFAEVLDITPIPGEGKPPENYVLKLKTPELVLTFESFPLGRNLKVSDKILVSLSGDNLGIILPDFDFREVTYKVTSKENVE